MGPLDDDGLPQGGFGVPAKIPLIQVDSFTTEAFRGNPAAVCLPPEEPSVAWMQAVAAEMNLSETAFVRRRVDGGFSIRWFTPTVEVPLCGHATLAAAHVLWEERLASLEKPITFHAQSGLLTARREDTWICLDFPTLLVEPCAIPDRLPEALGCRPLSVHRNRFGAHLVELDSEMAVREMAPDVAQLRREPFSVCIVTAASDSAEYDFVSRFFGPGLGIDEDPVTGSAHCSLGPFWAERLGKAELVGHQLSKRRGIVRVRVRDDRADILGQAVTVLRGELVA
jgi:PhzF family phenazine biosynthesis protein